MDNFRVCFRYFGNETDPGVAVALMCQHIVVYPKNTTPKSAYSSRSSDSFCLCVMCYADVIARSA